MLRKILSFLALVVLILAGIVTFRTLTAPNKQRTIAALPAPPLSDSALQHFRDAIHFQTVSYGDASQWDSVPFLQFRHFLETSYPLVHSKLTREIINHYSLLYKWEGKNTKLNPYIIMAHQDVVPIEDNTKDLWTEEPFGAVVKDGFIWGRGSTDDKINLIGILEAAEKLLKENFQPERTIYFVFGHDEEIGGKGATAIAQLLESRHIKADLIIDEGGIITRDKIPGFTKPVALIATSEKGYMSLEFSVTKKGGHSSMPERETAVDILTKALVKLHDQPFPPRLEKSTRGMLEFLGSESKFPNNMAFANTWLFKNMILSNYEKTGPGNAVVRTTSATTIIHTGIKDNVIPSVATAIVNFRLLPNDSSAWVIRQVKEIIDDDRVVIKKYGDNISEASPVADENGYGFQKIDQIVRKSYDSVITAPFLLVGATDSRHFSNISDNVIKFSPMVDPIGFHGIDERVSVESFRHTLWFFEQLMRNTN